VNPEVLEKMAEIRRLVEEVATDEMKAAMQKLREAMQKLDPKKIAEAAKNLSMTQEEFLKKLDRTIEMLKAAQNERRLEEMAKQLEQLAEKQEELREATEDASSDEMKGMSPEQQALQQETEQAVEKMEELAQEMKATEPDAAEAIEQTAEQIKGEKTPQEMNNAAQSMSGGKKNPATESQKKASESLSKAAQGMQSALAQMSSRNQEEIKAAIDKGIRDLLYLSKSEEALVGRAEKTSDRQKQTSPDLARRQSELKRGIESVAVELEAAMKMTMHIGPSVPELLRRASATAEESEAALAQGNIRVGELLGNRTMVGVNEGLVKLLEAQKNFSSACNNPSSSQAGSCENPGLNGLSQSQGQVNEGAQALGQRMGQGQRLTQSEEARLSQLAAEQQAIRQGLEEFAGQMNESQGVLGRLDKIDEEMEKMERELEERKPGEAAERGEKIMQRLLDADRALRRQGFKKERTSESARTGEDAPSPSAVSDMLQKADTKVREDILRTLSVRYPGEYEALIRAYFEALEKDGARAR
jgi:chromosome segregation ATPase